MKVNVYYNNEGNNLEEVIEKLFLECYSLEKFSEDCTKNV